MNKIGKTIKRRRREAKTDYAARLALLHSDKPRLVVRKTNRHIIAQIVVSSVAQDRVIVGANSSELLAHGWPRTNEGSLKSLPAAYLTGLLLAKKAKEKIPEAIADIGMHRHSKGSRVYALIAGVNAGGIRVPFDEKVAPDEARIMANQKTREAFIKLKESLTIHGRKRNKE